MNAILINPFSRTVDAIDLAYVPGGDLKPLYRVIFEADTGIVQAVDIGAGHDIWVDEEGLLQPWSEQAFFSLGGNSPLAGRALVLGRTNDDDCGPCIIPVEMIRQHVAWLNPAEVEVPAPTFQELDAELRPVGEPKPLAGEGAPAVWTYDNHGRHQ